VGVTGSNPVPRTISGNGMASSRLRSSGSVVLLDIRSGWHLTTSVFLLASLPF